MLAAGIHFLIYYYSECFFVDNFVFALWKNRTLDAALVLKFVRISIAGQLSS